jgi:hypothetical protein
MHVGLTGKSSRQRMAAVPSRICLVESTGQVHNPLGDLELVIAVVIGE